MRVRLSLRRALVATLACGAVACGLGTSGLMEVADDASTLPPVTPNGAGNGSSDGVLDAEPSAIDATSNGNQDAASSTSNVDGSSSSSSNDSASPPLVDSAPSIPDVGPPDVHVLDPDASYADSGDPCDLDEDGFLATGTCGGNDCCDYDSRAYPKETTYYATQDACGSFDYDCDAQDEPKYALVNCQLGFFQCTGDGFDKAPPPCGASATFDTCDDDVVYCGTSQSSKAQACK